MQPVPADAVPAPDALVPLPPPPPPPPIRMLLPDPVPQLVILTPPAPELPANIRAMLAAAVDANDANTVDAMVKFAKKISPEYKDDIEAIGKRYHAALDASTAEKEAARKAKIRAAGIFELWKGSVELGGNVTSGNTSQVGIYTNVSLKRTGINWEHVITMSGTYSRTSGVTDTERALAAYQPRYNIDANNYIYGLSQFEHDLSLGYRQRYTISAGAGIKAVNRKDLTIDLSVGPAIRHTVYYEDDMTTRLAARGSANIAWMPSKTVTLKEALAVYLEAGATTVASETSVESTLFGPLKSKLSYNINYESNPSDGAKTTDRIARASLIYSF